MADDGAKAGAKKPKTVATKYVILEEHKKDRPDGGSDTWLEELGEGEGTSIGAALAQVVPADKQEGRVFRLPPARSWKPYTRGPSRNVPGALIEA
jgi:hypothetical protein